MFIPLGDAPRESGRTPWVNNTLIAINFLVYAWASLALQGEAAHMNWVREWGFVPAAPRLATFFTHMFMHGGFFHVAGNMLFLWVFGGNVERRLGHAAYLFAYLAFGLAAVLLFRAFDPASTVPLVGASGAIFGVEGFYFLAFPRNQVRVLVWVILIFTFWLPARLVLGFSFVLNLLYTFSPKQGLGGGGVAYAAHVGGFVAGLLLGWGLRALTSRTERVEPRVQPSGEATRRLAEARRHLEAGQYGEAEAALTEVLRGHVYEPEAPEAALLLGHLYSRVVGRPEAALGALRFAARLHPDPAARRAAEEEILHLRGA